MNFAAECSGLPHAGSWFDALHAQGRQCGVGLSGSASKPLDSVAQMYACAVAWHNIVQDESLPYAVKCNSFARLADEAWCPTGRCSKATPSRILDFYASEEPGLAGRLYGDLSAVGPLPDGLTPKTLGSDELCSIIKRRQQTAADRANLRFLELLLESHLGDADRPVIWLAPYSDIMAAFTAGSAEEVVCKVGIENRPYLGGEPRDIYVLRVRAESIWDKLHVPSVADSRFYRLWAARTKADGPTGITRHTIKGRGYGVREFVVKSKDLLDLRERDQSAVWVDNHWPCGEVWMPLEHAERRWREEIGPAI